jgi:hypothetical protein
MESRASKLAGAVEKKWEDGGCEGDHALAKEFEKELALTVRSVCDIAEDQ